MAKSSAVLAPNLGLRYDKPSIALDPRELQEGLNFRVKEGKLSNLNLGWSDFSAVTLDGPVRLIVNFFIRGGTEHLVFATSRDLYDYEANTDTVHYITPVYATGTVTVTGDGISEAGANLGDMTGGGGINAAFDTTTAQAAAACASTASSTTAWVGRDLTTPSTIAGVTVHGSNNAGYVAGANPSVTITLYGKTGAAPASSTDGTVLGSITFTDTADESTGRVITSNDITTTWDNVWIKVDQGGAAAAMHVAEVLMFDPDVDVAGAGTDWDPFAKAGDFISFGSATESDPAADWYEIDSVTNDTNLVLVAPGAPKYPAGTAYTIRRCFTGDADDLWNYDTFVNAGGVEDRLYLTNGVEPIVRWNGTDTFATSLDSFTLEKVKTLTVYQNMMIYGNFEIGGTLYPTSIVNSDLGDPENITTGISEQFVVHSETDPISVVYPLADNLVIYSSRVLVIAAFVGDPIVFTFRTAATGVGPLSQNAVADFGDYHVFLGFDAQYKFDGVTLDTYGQHVWREVIRRNDPVRRSAAYALFDEENGDLYWVIAQTTDSGSGVAGSPPERCFPEHYLETVDPNSPNPVSQREFPFTAGGYFQRQTGLTWDAITDTWETLNFRWNDQFFFAAFPFILVGDANGKIYTLNTQQNRADGSALASYVRFGRRATGDGRMRGLVRRVYPFVTQFTTPLDVKVRLSDHAMGPITDTETVSFDQSLPEGGHFASVFRRARFFEPEFGSDGPSQPWELAGFDIDVTKGGYR